MVSELISASSNSNHTDHHEASSLLARFRAMEDDFFQNVHPQVDIGLAISEVQLARGNKPHIFTVHGCRHISDLIKSLDKVAESIANDGFPLTILERYILLCAAHVHDAANTKQRDSHPERCDELLQEKKALFYNPATIQYIYSVASVHGGKHPQYGKDTLRSLDADNYQPPRLPLLAAMLRLSDELSENPERVPQSVAKVHDHSPESKHAFMYAKSFSHFELRKDTLFLNYNVYPEQSDFTEQLNGTSFHYFDYLEMKLDVIDKEAKYCSQYGKPAFSISKITVTLRIYERALPSPVKETVRFSWTLLHGYPESKETICQRSPELKLRGADTLRSSIQSMSGLTANQTSNQSVKTPKWMFWKK
jgi:hypothetical protein